VFKENNNHHNLNIFSRENILSKRIKKHLKNHWSGKFYYEIFRQINEKDFSVLYKVAKGRPNVPVNILVGPEIIKEMFSLTFDVVYERYLF